MQFIIKIPDVIESFVFFFILYVAVIWYNVYMTAICNVRSYLLVYLGV